MDTSRSRLPTPERVREVLRYDPQTGAFLRNGRPAGTVNGRGYCQIRIDGVICLAHRVAVAYVTGQWPAETVDHIDGDKANNRYANLREVPQAVNAQNERRARANNRSGFLGVERSGKSGYQARITVAGKRVGLGSFSTPEAAHTAYLAGKRAMHEGNTL